MKQLTFGLAAFVAGLPLAAQSNPNHGELTHPHASFAATQAALDDWRVEHGSGWQMRFDDDVGQMRFLFGGKSAPLFEPQDDADFFSLARHAMEQTGDFHAVDPSTLVESSVKYLPLGMAGTTDKMAVEFQQEINGVPVQGGWVNAIFDLQGNMLALDIQAQPNMQGFPSSPSLRPERALDIADATFRAETGLPVTHFSAPELLIRQIDRNGFRVPALAWKVEMGYQEVDTAPAGQRYFIDAFLGDVLDRETTIHEFDVSGTVMSNVSPGTFPDKGSNPPQQQPMRYLKVTNNQNALEVFTDIDGNFNIPGATPGVQATFVYDGTYTTTNNNAGADYSLTTTLNQSTGNSVVMNPAPTELITAQANSADWIGRLRDFIRASDPGDATADFNALSNTNRNSNCNAFFNGNSVNFYTSGGGCVNTAYSSVVIHEMGHWFNVRYSTGNGSDGMGEGMADVFSLYLLDDPVVGQDFCGTGCNVRTGTNTRQFCGDSNPGCHGGVHANGEVLMGAKWKMRRNLKNTHGTGAGGMIADVLLSGWNNAFNQTQIRNIIVEQYITLDDDDGDINNGSPNYGDIQDGFEEQGFPGFMLQALQIDNVTELPDTLDEAGPYVVDADVVAMLNPPVTTVELKYSVNGGNFQTVAMGNVGGDTYQGSIPGQVCPNGVRYYVEGTDSNGLSSTFPSDAPASTLNFRVADVVVALEDDFETNKGWTAANNGASTGDWDRGVPVNDPNWAYDPESDSDGSGSCFLTENQNGNTDVDGGSVTLTSPMFDFGGLGDAEITYDYFLRMTDQSTDRLLVEISNNGGGSWTTIATHQTDGGLTWRTNVIDQQDLTNAGVALTPNMMIRYTANDSNPQSITEAALDAFRAVQFSCMFECPAPIVYCTPKGGLLCGLPAIGVSGASSAGSSSGFDIFAGPARGIKGGVLLYSNAGEAAIPFQGGFLCVNPAPLNRSVGVSSGGTNGSCDGEFRLDMNAFADGQLGGNPANFLKQVGQVINVQWWGRDTVAGGSFLSDAVEYVVCP